MNVQAKVSAPAPNKCLGMAYHVVRYSSCKWHTFALTKASMFLLYKVAFDCTFYVKGACRPRGHF